MEDHAEKHPGGEEAEGYRERDCEVAQVSSPDSMLRQRCQHGRQTHDAEDKARTGEHFGVNSSRVPESYEHWFRS